MCLSPSGGAASRASFRISSNVAVIGNPSTLTSRDCPMRETWLSFSIWPIIYKHRSSQCRNAGVNRKEYLLMNFDFKASPALTLSSATAAALKQRSCNCWAGRYLNAAALQPPIRRATKLAAMRRLAMTLRSEACLGFFPWKCFKPHPARASHPKMVTAYFEYLHPSVAFLSWTWLAGVNDNEINNKKVIYKDEIVSRTSLLLHSTFGNLCLT